MGLDETKLKGLISKVVVEVETEAMDLLNF